MVKIVGRQAVTARLRRMSGPEMIQQVGQALFVAASEIAVEAAHSITQGSISGKGHIPSSPGQPPNADTHALDRQIEAELVAPLRAQAQSNDPKSKHLEFGTSRMAARPFMSPAAQKKRERVTQLVRDAVNRVNKGAR